MGKMLRIHILDISYKDYDPTELNLMRNIGASSRHKIAKIDELIENARWPHSRHLENQFSTSLPKPLVALSQNVLCSNRRTSGSFNELKSCPLEIPNGRHSHHIENLFWTSSLKQQGELS